MNVNFINQDDVLMLKINFIKLNRDGSGEMNFTNL